jgi:hypothetical protein
LIVRSAITSLDSRANNISGTSIIISPNRAFRHGHFGRCWDNELMGR